MTIIMAVAMALGAQAAAPTSFSYVAISEPAQAELMRAVEQALPSMAPDGVAVRRAKIDPTGMKACLIQRGLGDNTNSCIRALVPDSSRGAPVIALRVGVQTISDVTGRRRHYRHTLYCIGARSLATASLGDHESPAGALRGDRRDEIQACLKIAMSPRNAALLSRDPRSGAALWRLPLTRYIPDNAAHARGHASEEALITVQQVLRPPGRRGQCLLRARVGQVKGYYFLRAGDLVEVAAPCSGPARAAFERAVAPAGIRPGSRARIHVDSSGDLRFVEPL